MMIQDIFPSRLDNSYGSRKAADENSFLMYIREGRLLANIRDGELRLPRLGEVSCSDAIYLFSVDGESFFLGTAEEDTCPDGYGFHNSRELRDRCTGKYLFAAFTAFHLADWYASNRYCGRCRGEMVCDDSERALVCSECGKKIYPRINPAVIVGVKNGDRLLITRYRTGFPHNALIAGFTEIGETLEQTVSREVMEEAGLRVKNIRYYKSQPWGIASDILVGFFCDVDGSDEIKMDESELRYAQWLGRKEIELQPNSHSLTNEMMKLFRDGEI